MMGESAFSGSSLEPELIEAAWAENRYLDALSRQSEDALLAKDEAYLAEQTRHEAAINAIRLLSEDESLSDVSLVKAYADTLERFGETYRLRQLEKMCEIGDKLIPGEVFFGYDGTVMTVAGERSDAKLSVAIPRIISSHDRLFGSHYRFAWLVPVEGVVGQGVFIDSPEVSIGFKEVKKELDAFHTGFGGSFESLLGTAADYALVGDAYQAETYQIIAANMAVSQLIDGKLMPYSDMERIIDTVINGGAYNSLVSELSKRFVRENTNVTDLHLLRIVKALLVYEQGEPATNKQACARYHELEEMGRSLVAEQAS